jgi:hypothetical protein
MKISLNAFISETHRHFGKYSPHQQSRMMFKFSVALSFFSLVLILTGLFVDQFHSEDPAQIKMENGRTYFGPGIVIGHDRLKLAYPECHVPEIRARMNSKMFNFKGISFSEMKAGPTGADEVFDAFVSPGDNSVSTHYFGNFNTFYYMSLIARVLSWMGLGFQALSLIVMVWKQTPPTSFLTRTPVFDQTDSQRAWGVAHHILALVASVCLIVNLCVVSMYLDLLVGRVIELSFELCNFDPGLDELETLKLFGHFLEDYSDVNGVTGSMYRLAMGLTMIQVTFVFYLGISKVRSSGNNTSYSLPIAKVRQLPWYCAIWRLRYSFAFFIVATVLNRVASLISREEGYPLNIYFFNSVASVKTGTGSVLTGSLSDFIMDKTSKFYVSERITRSTLSAAVPLVLALCIGSTDPQRFLSKVIQLAGIVGFLKSFTAISTVVPVPATPIAMPICYTAPASWSFSYVISGKASCNHIMFSLDAAVITLGIMVILLYIRYGQAIKKFVAYSVLLIMLGCCLVLPIAARLSYSVNVVIAFFVVALLVITQSQAFKLLFQLEVSEIDFTADIRKLRIVPGEVLNDKVIPNLRECVKRLEQYRMATKDATGLRLTPGDVEEIKVIYSTVGEALRVAKNAKPAEQTSSVGFLRRNDIPNNSAPTPPEADGDIDDVIKMMIHGQEPRPIVEVVVTGNQGQVIHETPVPLIISPNNENLQSEKST